MLFKNVYFKLSALSVVLQQALLALSTYYMAMAGGALGNQNSEKVLTYVGIFFALALGAYVVSSVSNFLENKLKNSLWNSYVFSTFQDLNFSQEYSSKKNKQSIVNWLTTEAVSTFESISSFAIRGISVYLNVLFTLTVFAFTLGYKITMVMAASLVISTVVVASLKGKISSSAKSIQEKKQDAMGGVSTLWSHHFFANSTMYNRVVSEQTTIFGKYFKETEKYTLTEQIIASTPIIISVPLVVLMMHLEFSGSVEGLGVVVAILPRSLQLFGNVHALSLINSRVLLMMYKYKNLMKYTSNVETQDLASQIDHDAIHVRNLSRDFDVDSQCFLKAIRSKEVTFGRYLITGKNGVGKSSFIRLIKNVERNSILTSPNESLLEDSDEGSSGQMQFRQFRLLCDMNCDIYLLDEWDANLDEVNTRRVDEEIEALARRAIVVEVRHLPRSRSTSKVVSVAVD